MRADGLEKLNSLDARGKFGFSGGFGRITFGYFRFGFYSKFSGIYSKKYYYGEPYISRMKFYRPTNPQTIKQQNWRAICAYAWVLWADVDSDQREQYRLQADKLGITGPNLFMSKWLKNRHGGFGNILFSYNYFGFS